MRVSLHILLSCHPDTRTRKAAWLPKTDLLSNSVCNKAVESKPNLIKTLGFTYYLGLVSRCLLFLFCLMFIFFKTTIKTENYGSTAGRQTWGSHYSDVVSLICLIGPTSNSPYQQNLIPLLRKKLSLATGYRAMVFFKAKRLWLHF